MSARADRSPSARTASAIFFIGFGALALHLGRDLSVGTADEMGVGYVPRMLAIGCILVGVLRLAERALLGVGDRFEIALRPAMLVSALVVGFAMALPILGLPVTIALVVLCAAVSGERFDWRWLALTAIVLALGCTLLFGWLLRLQIPLWPA
ncbi:MAG: tripartite tricarboxylate transporter TctB family protein [Alphaproteobacteria bacterium]|nr:tripartite tricarboxylate transporter TctB family protein [Alphaproteobacteria bacterium]